IGGTDEMYGRTTGGLAFLGERILGNYRNILASCPPVPWQILRLLAHKAGIHIYSNEGDVVYCNQSYLTIRASKPGRKTIALPLSSDLQELLVTAEEFVSSPVQTTGLSKTIEIDFSMTGETRFFQVDKA